MALLWTGTCNSSKPGYVSWVEVCKPKIRGGLGFRSLVSWNIAIAGKLVWDIIKKVDNLWVKWIHDKYFKEHDWLSYNAPSSASWIVKHICKGKQVVLGLRGNGWFDKDKFSTAETYKKMQIPGETLHWCRAIWDHHNVFKYSFVGWLAMKNRMQTRSKLAAIGVCLTNSYLLCDTAIEDHNHF